MTRSSTARAAAFDPSLADEDVVARVLAGDVPLFEILMRRHNQRLYRVVRGVLRDESEIEDVMQQAYVSAFTHLDQFAGRAQFSTWLCRIGVNEALARVRGAARLRLLDDAPSPDWPSSPDWQHSPNWTDTAESGGPMPSSSPQSPEAHASRGQLVKLLEEAVDALPEIYRVVFVLREIEELSTAETAACLSLTEEAVKVRLHRARGMLRDALYARVGEESAEAFRFDARRCDRIVAAVFAEILDEKGEPG